MTARTPRAHHHPTIPVQSPPRRSARGDRWIGAKEKLGFEAGSRYPDYAICARDGIQVHFWLTEDTDIPKATSCRIDVEGIDALYEEMGTAGVVHPNGPLRNQPWGMREFAVLDGDGNLIKFGERTSTA